MKKTAFYLIALATLSIAAVSCTKDEAAKGPQFRISMESASSKTHFNGTNLYWTNGDQFAVYDATNSRALYSAAAEGDQALTATLNIMDGTINDGPYTAIYPNSIATASPSVVTLPAEQASVAGELTGFPMMAVSDNEELSFKNPCAILKIHMQKSNISISKIQIATDQYINGDFTIDYNDGEPALTRTNSTNHTKVTTLTMANPVSITEGADFCLYLPAAQYGYFLLKIYDADGNILSKSFSGLNFGRNQYRTLNIPESAINFHPGDLTGEFTVNANGAKVTFSKGNLLQSLETGDYEFGNRQYTSSNTSGYQGYFNQGVAQRVFTDEIINAGEGPWRCLSANEWAYLLRTRNTAYDNHRSAVVKIKDHNNNARNVLLLFPDDFHWPLEENRQPTSFDGNNSSAEWNGKTYTYNEWRILEDAGCVCLRVCGSRLDGTSVQYGTVGFYWSTTQNPRSERYYYTRINATNTPFPTSQESGYSSRHCIRLVKDVQ